MAERKREDRSKRFVETDPVTVEYKGRKVTIPELIKLKEEERKGKK